MKRKFAERLKELRQDAGLSCENLGKKIGVSANSISKWETNKADITSDHLIDLAKYFKVSTDYLLGLED